METLYSIRDHSIWKHSVQLTLYRSSVKLKAATSVTVSHIKFISLLEVLNYAANGAYYKKVVTWPISFFTCLGVTN